MMGGQTGSRTSCSMLSISKITSPPATCSAALTSSGLERLRRHLSEFYSHTGRPSIDPEIMIRMLVIGYCFGIRSERRCEEVHLNLAYRWFCQLGLEDNVPDHSTFSKNRHGRFRQSETWHRIGLKPQSCCHNFGDGSSKPNISLIGMEPFMPMLLNVIARQRMRRLKDCYRLSGSHHFSKMGRDCRNEFRFSHDSRNAQKTCDTYAC